jgi:iron complex outermembrane receptor protein
MKPFKKLPHQHQMIQHACALLLGSTLFSQIALAQSNLENIVVSGSRFEENIDRVPANIQVITKEQIQQSTSTNLAEVLQQIGNVQMVNQSGSLLGVGQQGSSPDLGGYGVNASSNTLVLLNGVRLNPMDSQSAPLNIVPISSIERIEIVNGGASVQFGNNATGGVINIITKEGSNLPSQASVSYGSYGSLITDISLLKKENNTSLSLFANSSKTNGWRENSDALSNSFNGRLTQGLGGLDKIFIEANAYHMQASSPYTINGFEVGKGNPYLSNLTKKGDGFIQDGSAVRAGITKELGNDFLFEIDGAYGSNSSLSPQQGLSFLYDKRQMNITPRIKANWGKWGTTIVGYDYNNSDGGQFAPANQFGPSSSSHVNLKNQSIYMMERLPIYETLDLVGGIRRQQQDIRLTTINKVDNLSSSIPDGTYLNTFWANAYDLGINYRYLPGQRLYTKYDQSYRFANTDEYFGFNPVTQQNFSTGAILRPQINKTIEIGGDFTYGQSKINIGIFQTDSHDEIRLFNDPTTQSQNNINDADIRRTGININGTTKASPSLNLGAGLRYQRAVYTSGLNSGYLVSLVPQYLFSLNARYQATSQITAGGVLNYVASQYYDGDLQNAYNQMPSYAFGDVYAEYKIKAWEARFSIKNVSNTNYAVYGSNQTYFEGGFAYNYLPAPPRTFWVSLRYNFDL